MPNVLSRHMPFQSIVQIKKRILKSNLNRHTEVSNILLSNADRNTIRRKTPLFR